MIYDIRSLYFHRLLNTSKTSSIRIDLNKPEVVENHGSKTKTIGGSA